MAIPVFNPTIRRKEMDSVLNCLVSDQIGPGALSQKLLDGLKKHLDHNGGVCFREPQRAIECILLTLEPKREGKILLSALAPGFYVDVIQLLGFEVVLCDVDSSSGLMLIDDLVEKSKECIILIIDYPIGNYNDVEILNKLEIPIIEDISCSIGTFTENFRPGSLGKYVLVGLEENHLITAGGGAVVVAHSRSDVTNLKKSYDLMDKTVLLPDMNSALAIVQSSSLSSRLEKRQLYFELFFSQLQKGGHKTLVLGYEIESLLYSFPVFINLTLLHHVHLMVGYYV